MRPRWECESLRGIAVGNHEALASRTETALDARVAAAAFLAALPAGANFCYLDPVPAATLLLPYFELDLAPGATDDVIVTINNAYSPGRAGARHLLDRLGSADDRFRHLPDRLRRADLAAARRPSSTATCRSPPTCRAIPPTPFRPRPLPAWEAQLPGLRRISFLSTSIRSSGRDQPRTPARRPHRPADQQPGQFAAWAPAMATRWPAATSHSTASAAARSPSRTTPAISWPAATSIANNRNTLWGDYLIRQAGAADVGAALGASRSRGHGERHRLPSTAPCRAPPAAPTAASRSAPSGRWAPGAGSRTGSTPRPRPPPT